MKYNVGDKVRIKSLDWYNKNKDEDGDVSCGEYDFVEGMKKFCSETLTISEDVDDCYLMLEDYHRYVWTDEMIEGLVEESDDLEKMYMESEKRYEEEYSKGEYCHEQSFKWGFQESCDYAYENEKLEINLKNGYQFVDENGNVINATKIVLEKANTLKTQSDNMKTETHRGYYTTEEDTTNKSKKLAWFSFFDSNFADKVELDLSNRELIQEDGKWFVVKKKKEYPKTYEECLPVLEIFTVLPDVEIYNAKPSECKLFETFIRLKRCRDAYWKIAGEEMGLGKPWEPDYNSLKTKYTIEVIENKVVVISTISENHILAFPTEEMRDAFYENFKELIESCKELL